MNEKGSAQPSPTENHQPLSAQLALGQGLSIKEPCLIDDWVLWLEQRPQEKGRTTLMIRPWGRPDLTAQELTPAPANLRSRVHDYGGGLLATASEDNQLLLSWIDDQAGCLCYQRWQSLNQTQAENNGNWLQPLSPTMQLSCPGAAPLGGGLIDLARQRWLGVMEANGQDWLVSFSLNLEHQQPKVVHQPADFVGYPSLSPDGEQLAWIEWQQPSMPWDCSQLWCGSFDESGTIKTKVWLAGNNPEQESSASVFQPLWLPNGDLVIAEDSNGWWNLMVTTPSTQTGLQPSWRRPWPMAAETAMPQWVFGMSTTTWDGEKLLAAICEQGCWHLSRLALNGEITNIDQPFNDLAGIQAKAGRAVAIASNAVTGSGLLEIDLKLGTWQHTPASEAVLKAAEISVPEPFWFEGYGQEKTHAWFYPPRQDHQGPAPLLVKSHSGPTSMARPGLNLSIQFWTSRGWGVVDVNYGGSTGFGRAYRERLQGGWGVVDVQDCAAAARALVTCGKAKAEQIAIEGGSAGGFTTLACLCFTDVFRAGACRYGVSDLSAMAEETHRFEARYLDGLIGPWPEAKTTYNERSPLLHAEQINCPVIFFQGSEDKVVPREQTERMATALRNKDVPVDMHIFEGEGHGFRDSVVLIEVLNSTEQFFNHFFELKPRDESSG
ncbi:MAG: DUF829 domain-containing protein [Prochlorococcus sp.]